MSTLSGDSARADLRKDTISHFILRLAYCRSEDLRRWFLTQVRGGRVLFGGRRGGDSMLRVIGQDYPEFRGLVWPIIQFWIIWEIPSTLWLV